MAKSSWKANATVEFILGAGPGHDTPDIVSVTVDRWPKKLTVIHGEFLDKRGWSVLVYPTVKKSRRSQA